MVYNIKTPDFFSQKKNKIQPSIRVVSNAITVMPLANEHICFNDSLGFFSSNSSGNTVTNAICKKPPAVNGKIHEVRASTAEALALNAKAVTAPRIPADAV